MQFHTSPFDQETIDEVIFQMHDVIVGAFSYHVRSRTQRTKKTNPSSLLLMHTDPFKHYLIPGVLARNECVFRAFTGPLADGVGCGWVDRQPRGTVPRGGLVVPLTPDHARDSHLSHRCWRDLLLVHATHTPPVILSYHQHTRLSSLLCVPHSPHPPDWSHEPTGAEQLPTLRLWLAAGHNSDPIYCLGYGSLFICIMWFHCHANRVWSRQTFDCHVRRVTHLMPWHWKIRGDRKQVMAHWEKRGNLLTVTFLLNVAWRRRINTEQRQGSWMENHFI